MAPPVFALYVTCLLLGRVALELSSSLRFESVNAGEEVTLECFYENPVAVRFYWFKQTLGEKPQLLSKFYKHDKIGTLTDEFKNNRFKLETTTGNHLRISDVQISDSATYHCVSGYLNMYEFSESIIVNVKGTSLNVQALVHRSASETIQPGGSVTLNCTVHTGTCDGEHSVYWFKSSEESSPGLIYTHGNRNSQCVREPVTHTCIYNLTLENLNPSHIGTYYCVVATCGHILFGDGTKLDFEEKVDHPRLVYFLSGALAFTTVLVVSLAYTAYRLYKTNCQCTDSQARSTAALNIEGHQDNLHYAVVGGHRVSRQRRQIEDTWNECVYSSVKR